MAVNARVPFLICYDIANPRRLGRIHRLIGKHAIMVQYSIYYTEMSYTEIRELAKLCESVCHAKEDDIRFYALSRDADITLLGRHSALDMLVGSIWDHAKKG